MVQIDQFLWSITDVASLTTAFKTYNLYKLMLLNPFVASTLSNFAYFRADVEVHVRMNTNAMYAGALMVTASPSDEFDTVKNFQQARSWLKPVVVSAQSQSTAIISLPWVRPERFLESTDFTVGELVSWQAYVDVLSPLVNSSPSGSESILVDIQARFVNAKVFWPIAPAGPLPMRVIRQESARMKPSRMSNRMSAATQPTTRNLIAPYSPAPAISAVTSQATSAVNSTTSTITNVIDSVMDPIEDVLGAVQPLLQMGGLIASFFDKPEINEEITRVYNVTGANMCTVDTKDVSLPLTLYSTSYLSTDEKTIPDGGPWKLVDMVMRPSLAAQWNFKADQPACVLPYNAPGTPFSFVCALHKFWRASMRYQLRFFCSTFTSARFLIVYTPAAVPADNEITNTVSRLIDVRGDTVVEFTVPFVSQTDFVPLTEAPGSIQVTLYNDIVNGDVSTEPAINMVVFVATGPDAQFQMPVAPAATFDYLYPNAVAPVPRRRGYKPSLMSDFIFGICNSGGLRERVSTVC